MIDLMFNDSIRGDVKFKVDVCNDCDQRLKSLVYVFGKGVLTPLRPPEMMLATQNSGFVFWVMLKVLDGGGKFIFR